MINLLNSIVNFVISIIHFIIHVFNAMISFIGMIPVYVNFLSTSLVVLPPFVLPFATLGISLSIITMIINHKVGDK